MKKENPIHKILTTLIWKYKYNQFENPILVKITYVNRGSPNDLITISIADVAAVMKGSLLLEDGETQIPFHRITLIEDFKQLVIYKRKESRP